MSAEGSFDLNESLREIDDLKINKDTIYFTLENFHLNQGRRWTEDCQKSINLVIIDKRNGGTPFEDIYSYALLYKLNLLSKKHVNIKITTNEQFENRCQLYNLPYDIPFDYIITESDDLYKWERHPYEWTFTYRKPQSLTNSYRLGPLLKRAKIHLEKIEPFYFNCPNLPAYHEYIKEKEEGSEEEHHEEQPGAKSKDEQRRRKQSDKSYHSSHQQSDKSHHSSHQKSEKSRRNSKNYSAPFCPHEDEREKERNFSEDSSSVRRHRESSKQAKTSTSHSHSHGFNSSRSSNSTEFSDVSSNTRRRCETFEQRYQKNRLRQRKESEKRQRKRKDKKKRRGGIQKREINLVDETEQTEFEYQGIHAEKQEEKIEKKEKVEESSRKIKGRGKCRGGKRDGRGRRKRRTPPDEKKYGDPIDDDYKIKHYAFHRETDKEIYRDHLVCREHLRGLMNKFGVSWTFHGFGRDSYAIWTVPYDCGLKIAVETAENLNRVHGNKTRFKPLNFEYSD